MLTKQIYTCSKCGGQFPKWSGRCFECGGWGTITEDTVESKSENRLTADRSQKVKSADIIDLRELNANASAPRLKTNIAEVDRVLGGGIFPGSIMLLGGEPGIGKSTLLAQIAHYLASPVIYVSGEESAVQLKDRLVRLGVNLENFKYSGENNVEKIIALAREQNPALLIIDSIQTVFSSQADNEVGSVTQIKAATALFLELAKMDGIPIILVGHITKDGSIAGPKNTEHMVDVVLQFETDKTHYYRVLRAHKNRFGSTDEVGVFEMSGGGFREVKNPGALFLDEGSIDLAGSALSCHLEGARPFLLEIQALTAKTFFGYPQRKTSGFDLGRLQILTTVLTKKTKINLSNQDVILNLIGGFRVSSSALDLAACFAIASSFFEKPIDRRTIILGEVGLGGEIRNIPKIKERLKEASRLGFTRAIIPKTAKIQPSERVFLIDSIDDIGSLIA